MATKTMEKLKVLVCDKAIHIQAAYLLLDKDYDLTVATTYEEALEALAPRLNHKKFQSLLGDFLEKVGLKRDFGRWDDNDKTGENKKKHSEASEKARKLATSYPDFDVVLTGLLIPDNSSEEQGEESVGQEMPLGTTIALHALFVGVKRVAVVSDDTHRASLDFFRTDGLPCQIEGVKIICTHDVRRIEIDDETCELVDDDFLKSEEGKVKYPYPEGGSYGYREGIVRGGKNWKNILLRLIDEPKTE